jgi:hypothetical protein
MHGLRVCVPRIAGIWLCCQFAIFAAAPVAFAATATLVTDKGCECPDARPGQACPMHAGSPAENSDSTTCYMRGTCASFDVALLTLGSGAGVLAPRTTQGVEFVVARVDHVAFNPIFQPDALDSPPPRS